MSFTAENETPLPRWSVADVHESFNARSFTDAMERAGSNVARLEALFETHNVRSVEPRTPNAQDGAAADAVIQAFNKTVDEQDILISYIYATVSTDSREEQAQGLLSEMEDLDARISPLLARLADWVASLDANALKAVSNEAREHLGPLLRLQDRAIHQMSEAEEGLYAELGTTGSSAWGRLQSDLTSQLSVDVHLPTGTKSMPMAAVRGLATDNDLAVRKAAYEAEMQAWPTVAVACAKARLQQPMFRRRYLQFRQAPLATAFVVACDGRVGCCDTRVQVREQLFALSQHFRSSSTTRVNDPQQMTCRRLHRFFLRVVRHQATAHQLSGQQVVQDGRCSSRTHLSQD